MVVEEVEDGSDGTDAANISVLYLAMDVRKDGRAAGQGVKDGGDGASWLKMSVSSLLCVDSGEWAGADSSKGLLGASCVGVLSGEVDGVGSQVSRNGGWIRGSGAFGLFLIQASVEVRLSALMIEQLQELMCLTDFF